MDASLFVRWHVSFRFAFNEYDISCSESHYMFSIATHISLTVLFAYAVWTVLSAVTVRFVITTLSNRSLEEKIWWRRRVNDKAYMQKYISIERWHWRYWRRVGHLTQPRVKYITISTCIWWNNLWERWPDLDLCALRDTPFQWCQSSPAGRPMSN